MRGGAMQIGAAGAAGSAPARCTGARWGRHGGGAGAGAGAGRGGFGRGVRVRELSGARVGVGAVREERGFIASRPFG